MDKKLEINDFATGEKREITMEIDQGDLIILEHKGLILNVVLNNGVWEATAIAEDGICEKRLEKI